MTMGKHVYCQKPLTHSFTIPFADQLAASTGVVTQMGNQGASGRSTDLVCEWIWNGEIGEVTRSGMRASRNLSEVQPSGSLAELGISPDSAN